MTSITNNAQISESLVVDPHDLIGDTFPLGDSQVVIDMAEDEKTYKQLGTLIRLERTKKGMTQAELAKAADISLHTMGRIERGADTVAIGTIFHIFDILKIPREDFFKLTVETSVTKNPKDCKALARNLKRLTEASGITIYDLASKSGIEYSTMEGYFKGHRFPSPKNLSALAKALNINPNELWMNNGVEPNDKDCVKDGQVDIKLLENKLNDLAAQFERGIGYLEAIIKRKK